MVDAVAVWLFAVGAVEEAVLCLSAADRTRPDSEMNWDADRVATRSRLVERARMALARSAFNNAWAAGQTLALAAVLDRGLTAMNGIVPPEVPTTRNARGRRDLSPRELEVLALDAYGRSDGEIAAQLFITKKTASVHVAHIKDKLAAENRVEIAMAGVRLCLVRPTTQGR